MTDPKYNKHILSLTALFVLGDAIIVLPFDAEKFTVFGLFFGVLLSIILFFISFFVCKFLLLNEKNFFIIKFLSSFIFLAASVYALYSAALTFKRYMHFVDRVLLPDTPKFLIAFLFISVSLLLAYKNKKVILKLALVFVIVAIFAVALFFLLSLKNFKAENILVYSLPSAKTIFAETMPYLFTLSFPALLIPAYSLILDKENKISAQLTGLISGLALSCLCIIECLMLFGAPLASRLEFPLSSAVSTVTVGPLFFRLDGVVYCLFFITALIKTSICMKLCYVSLKRGIKSVK